MARELAPVGLRSSPKTCDPVLSAVPSGLVWRLLRSRAGASSLATGYGVVWIFWGCFAAQRGQAPSPQGLWIGAVLGLYLPAQPPTPDVLRRTG